MRISLDRCRNPRVLIFGGQKRSCRHRRNVDIKGRGVMAASADRGRRRYAGAPTVRIRGSPWVAWASSAASAPSIPTRSAARTRCPSRRKGHHRGGSWVSGGWMTWRDARPFSVRCCRQCCCRGRRRQNRRPPLKPPLVSWLPPALALRRLSSCAARPGQVPSGRGPSSGTPLAPSRTSGAAPNRVLLTDSGCSPPPLALPPLPPLPPEPRKGPSHLIRRRAAKFALVVLSSGFVLEPLLPRNRRCRTTTIPPGPAPPATALRRPAAAYPPSPPSPAFDQSNHHQSHPW